MNIETKYETALDHLGNVTDYIQAMLETNPQLWRQYPGIEQAAREAIDFLTHAYD